MKKSVTLSSSFLFTFFILSSHSALADGKVIIKNDDQGIITTYEDLTYEEAMKRIVTYSGKSLEEVEEQYGKGTMTSKQISPDVTVASVGLLTFAMRLCIAH